MPDASHLLAGDSNPPSDEPYPEEGYEVGSPVECWIVEFSQQVLENERRGDQNTRTRLNGDPWCSRGSMRCIGRLAKEPAMNAPRIVVCGRQNDELSASLKQQIPNATVEFCTSDCLRTCSQSRRLVDVFIWFFSAAQHREVGTPHDLMNRHPLAAVLVVGYPADRRVFPNSFGGTVYLGEDATATIISEQVRRALRASWWWGVKDFDVPILVVDTDGHVVRANATALSHFGPGVIEQPYALAIEGSDSPSFPAGHPIAEALTRGVPVKRYHECAKNSDLRNVQLICRPVFSADMEVRAATVMIVDMNRWAQMTKAAARFSNAETMDDLCQMILAEAQRLGFSRVRIYEYFPKTDILRGRVSVGFTGKRDEWFQEEFSFPRESDPPSQETLRVQHPRLYIRPEATEASSATDGVRPPDYVRELEPGHAKELELENVRRWIESRLSVPTAIHRQDRTEAVQSPWGKICVDKDARSDQLDAGDVTTVALFAEAASSAIAAVQRLENERRHLEIFRRNSEKLAKARWRGPDELILDRVVNLLLQMYLEITGADVVFYRELHHGDVLRVRHEPRWRKSIVPDGCQVPHEKRRGEGTSGRVIEMQHPEWGFENNAFEAAQELLTIPNRWNPQEKEFLKRIGSEIYIPVVVHGELRGVIVAIAWEVNAFSSDLKIAVERFMHTAGLWFELGELHDGRAWAAKTLRDLIAVLPDVAQARDDDAFFAALAAMLSAHDGLGWNRVFIFSCRGPHPDAAELVYALGGRGEELHHDVQVGAQFLRLAHLVRKRLTDPVPHGVDCSGRDCNDSLYEMCVETPCKAQDPILIPFGKGGSEEDSSVDGGDAELFRRHPLRWLLEQDYSDPLHLNVSRKLPNAQWFEDMNCKFPAMFLPAKRYAFPLRCKFTLEQKHAFGIVVVEITDIHDRPVDQTLPVTSVLLDLVADIMAFRHRSRFVRGWLGALPAFRHHLGLKDSWDAFTQSFDEFQEEIDQIASTAPEHGQERKVSDILDDLRQDVADVDAEIDNVNQAQLAFEAIGDVSIPDVGAHLHLLANRWERLRSTIKVVREWDAVDGRSLHCDQLIFDETLETLITNALDAAEESGDPQLEVRVSASVTNRAFEAFSEIIEFRITDTGPGIPADVASWVFLDGFSTHGGQKVERAAELSHSGRGLSVARAQILTYHGDLQLADPGPHADETSPSGRLGATFVLRFGIPKQSIARSGDRSAEFAGDSEDGETTIG